MQHAIGDHALLADSRTAALVGPDGNVAWMCWPRVDSSPLLMSILDDRHGGTFLVRPAGDAGVQSCAYLESSLVLRTIWRTRTARLIVDDALVLQGSPCLLRRLHADGGDVAVRTTFRRAAWTRAANVVVRLPSQAPPADAGGGSEFTLRAGDTACAALCDTGTPAAGGDALDATLAAWRARLRRVDRVGLLGDAASALGESRVRRLLHVSAAVLCGLLQTGGGIVAAPTTSLPQWPRSSRCWDYRYCWLRDAALAGRALLRLGLLDEAFALGAFLGDIVTRVGVRPVVRVDGAEPPPERELAGAGGYGGAIPVRIGNAAAAQLQLDVAGEVLELAGSLATEADLPPALAAAAPRLAGWAVEHERETDHGIWEVRGRPRHYTHSRLTAGAGLLAAAALAASGRIAGDGAAWQAAAARLQAAALAGSGALQLHAAGGGPDAALSLAVAGGLLGRDDPRAAATLDAIAAELDHDGLLDRYVGQPDGIADPCAPFVFPSFWMADAERALGRDARPRIARVAATCGRHGLYGEVVDPQTGGPLGNYPQVQSHAAFVLAVTAPS